MKTFEERLNHLETIATRLRDGETGIEEATTLFEEGITLSRALQRELQTLEQRVEILMRESDTGEPEFEDFTAGEEQ